MKNLNLLLKNIFLLSIFLVIFTSNVNAAQVANDQFKTGLDGYTGSGISWYSGQGGWMDINPDKTATKTYNLGNNYVNATVTITFRIWANSKWDNSDRFEVRVNGSKLGSYKINNGGIRVETITTTADSNGNVELKFTPNTNQNNEYGSVDYVTIDATIATVWIKNTAGTSAHTDPTPYGDNADITETLTSPTNSSAIKVTVSGSTENDYDFLYITDSAGNTVTFDGTINNTYNATGPTVSIRFTSDSNTQPTNGGVTVSITDIIVPVQANPDSYSTPVDTPLVVSDANGTLANDTGSGIIITDLDDSGLQGTIDSYDTSTGAFTFTPKSHFTGTTTFTYTITDNTGHASTATVTIHVEVNTSYGGTHAFYLINPDSARNIRGNFKIAGNTLLCVTNRTSGFNNAQCLDNRNYNDNDRITKYIDIDNDTSTWNSSSSNITLPDTYDQKGGKGILWAGLFWQGNVNTYGGTQRLAVANATGDGYTKQTMNGGNVGVTSYPTNKIKFKIDTGNYNDIKAYTHYSYAFYGNRGFTYGAYADVTHLLQEANLAKGKHTFTIANLTTNEGHESNLGDFGGWSLVVIYQEDLNGNPRNVSIYNGYARVSSNSGDTDISISGFKLPSKEHFTADLAMFAGEGEYVYGAQSNKHDTVKIGSSTNNFTNIPVNSGVDPSNIFDAKLSNIDRDHIAGKANDLTNNNNGIDIDTFDVSSKMEAYKAADPDIDTIYLRLNSNQDYVTPSMLSFSTELYVPKFCYDYTLDIGGYVIPSTNNRIITTLGGYGIPLRTHIFLKSTEGDLQFTDVNLSYSIDNTAELHYIPNSTEIAENGTVSYVDAHTWTVDESDKGFSMYIGTGKTASSGGTIGPEEVRYIKLDSVFQNPSVNTYFNLDLFFNVDYGSGNAPMHQRLQAADLCPAEEGFHVTYGDFNIVDPGSNGNIYNLYTQVSGRPFNLKVYGYTSSDVETPDGSGTDLNLSVEVEFIRADDFMRSMDVTCQDEDAVLDRNMTQAKQRAKFVHIDDNYATVHYTADDVNFAYRSLAMRVWYFVNGDGSLIKNHNCTRNNQAGCEALFNRTFSALTDSNGTIVCENQCRTGGSGCYDCLRLHYTKKVCSRDNFSVRPEAFVTTLIDSQESDDTDDESKTIVTSKALTSNTDIVAGYKYRFDINATSHNNDNAVPYYIQQFNNISIGHQAVMAWNAPSGLSCNDPDDKNLTFNIINGSSVNTYTKIAQTGKIDQIGEYLFKISDINWTSTDWKDTLMTHHNGSHFADGDDCTYNSDATTGGITGCKIVSNHAPYTDLPVEFFPYTFNANSLTPGAGPANSGSIVYINTLAAADYPNGIDENMSYNIQGTFSAKGYHGADVSNFVNNCYASPVDMTLQFAYHSDIPVNTSEFTYDLVDYNETHQSTIVRPRTQSTFSATLVKDTKTPVTITQNAADFEQSMKGKIAMDLGYNFDRTNNTPLNPRRIEFYDFNLTYQSSPNINVDMKNDYQIFGDQTIDQNITFLYARTKPEKIFYDDITTHSVKTPVAVVAYCDLSPTECQNRGLALYDPVTGKPVARTNEAYWWKALSYNNDPAANGKDGKIYLTISGAALSTNTVIINNSNGSNNHITVTRNTAASLPLTVPIDLVTYSTASLANYTDRWLIYNPYSPGSVPSPFYRVRFTGSGGWTGKGKTGHVVGGSINKKKTRRLEW